MTYLLKNNKKRYNKRTFGIIGAIVLVCIVIGLLVRKPLSLMVGRLFIPVVSIRTTENGVIEYIRSWFISSIELQERITILEQENQRLRDEIVLLSDTSSLQTHSGTSSELRARVIVRPPFSAFDTMVLSQGSRAGVVIGDTVSPLDRMVPVGRIVEVSAMASRAMLFSSAGENFVITVGTSSEQWKATGMGGGMFEVRIPQSQKIIVGDTIFVPEFGKIPYAKVTEIISDKSSTFQIIRFLLPVSLYGVETVRIDI